MQPSQRLCPCENILHRYVHISTVLQCVVESLCFLFFVSVVYSGPCAHVRLVLILRNPPTSSTKPPKARGGPTVIDLPRHAPAKPHSFCSSVYSPTADSPGILPRAPLPLGSDTSQAPCDICTALCVRAIHLAPTDFPSGLRLSLAPSQRHPLLSSQTVTDKVRRILYKQNKIDTQSLSM